MRSWSLELINLVQENGGIKFSIVSSPDSLYSLEDRVLVPVVEKIRDFAGPVHGLDFDFNGFGLIGRDDVIHCAHIAPWFDLDCVSRLDLHGSDLVT